MHVRVWYHVCMYVCVTMHVFAVVTCSEKVRVQSRLPHDTAWPSVMLPAPIFPGCHFIRLPGDTVVRVYAGGVEAMHVDAQTPACSGSGAHLAARVARVCAVAAPWLERAVEALARAGGVAKHCAQAPHAPRAP
jgi:hypothetical protein